jgi:hypothetical protein
MDDTYLRVGVTYPDDGRTYHQSFRYNYVARVHVDTRGRIEVDVKGNQGEFDRTHANLSFPRELASWLASALLTAVRESKPEQRIEIRAAIFPKSYEA